MIPSTDHSAQPVSEQLLLIKYAVMLTVLILLTTIGISMAGATSFSDKNNADLFGRLVVDTKERDTRLSAVRLGVKTSFSEELAGKFEVDFSHDVMEIDNAYLAFGKQRQIRVGTQKLIRGFSAATSSLHSSFVNRPALFRLTGGLQRDIGLHGYFSHANWLIQPAFFLTDGDARYTAAVRSVYRSAKHGNRAWHLGASLHSAPARETTAGTPSLPDQDNRQLMVAAEGLVKQRNWYLAGEVLARTTGSRKLSGFYADAGLMFGGQMRYSHRKAALTSRTVDRPLSSGGPGAFEVAVRHEQITTNYPDADKNRQIQSELSLIWYPEEQIRLIVGKQFTHNNSVLEDQEPQKFQARLQVSF